MRFKRSRTHNGAIGTDHTVSRDFSATNVTRTRTLFPVDAGYYSASLRMDRRSQAVSPRARTGDRGITSWTGDLSVSAGLLTLPEFVTGELVSTGELVLFSGRRLEPESSNIVSVASSQCHNPCRHHGRAWWGPPHLRPLNPFLLPADCIFGRDFLVLCSFQLA